MFVCKHVPKLKDRAATEDIHETNTASSKKTRGLGYVYEFYQLYETIEEAVHVVEAEGNWRRKNKRKFLNGFRWDYQCNKVKARCKDQCKSALYILLHINNTNCSIYRTYCK